MIKSLKRVVVFVFAVVFVSLSESAAFAVDYNGQPYNGPDPGNNIIFYDGDLVSDTACSPGSTVLAGNDNIEKAMSFFIGKGLTAEQSAGIIGNLIAESGVIPDRQEDGQAWGRGGWGLAQWTGGRRTNLVNAMNGAGIGDLYKEEYKNQKTPADKVDTLLAFQLEFLWGEFQTNENSAFQALQKTTTVADAATVILTKFERPKNATSHIPKRTSYAQGVLDTYGGATPTADTTASPGASNASCNGSGSAFQGDIVKTALSLAWDSKGHGSSQSDAKPEYQTAMPQFNGSTGSGNEDPWSDCGVFVATVMRMSKADPEYPLRGTQNQLTYLKSSQKYIEVQTNKVEDLKPGDIFIFNDAPYGHTFIFTGPFKGSDGKDYNIVEASLGSQVPQAGNVYFTQGRATFKIYRLK